MKKYNIVILLISLLVFPTACDNDGFLEIDNPNSTTVNEFWRSTSHAEAGIAATYSALQSPNVMGGDGMLNRMLMGDLVYPRGFNDKHLTFHLFAMESNTQDLERMWKELYTGVFRANQVLTSVPGIDMNENTREIILGEAHFLRALYYFWLINYYNGGEIPLVTEVPTNPDEIYVDLSPRSEVQALILSDLEAARASLPESWDNANTGRATWGAATAILAKVYLYDQNWAEAARLFKEVIDSGIYSLVADPADNFNIVGEHNNESIFEVAFSASLKEGTNPGAYRDHDSPVGSEATSRARNMAPTREIGGWSSILVHGYLGELLVGDTLDLSKSINTGRTFSIRSEASVGTRFDDLPYYGGVTNDANRNRNYWGLFWRKFQNHTLPEEDRAFSRSGINENIIRLADVYLMYAEALVERDGVVSQEAIDALNQVRERAGVVQKFTEDFPTTGAFIDYLIWYERPRELCVEGFGIRWNDLRRRGLLERAFQRLLEGNHRNYGSNNANARRGLTALNFENQRANNFILSKHEFFPLPSSETLSNLLLQN